MDDDEDRIRDITSEEFVNCEIRATEFGTCMVPADYFLAGCCYISS